jgi:fanconi anemia group M protein
VGDTWIYPINAAVREYQLRIVEAALLRNTLVCLPTGLGKTFIAAVVMYNYYRWFPQGKLVFMAPTKPLVAQQVDGCLRFTGIRREHVAELTGAVGTDRRPALWRSKRVFFLTPQVLQRDLESGACPGETIVCLVVDEAHRFGRARPCRAIPSPGRVGVADLGHCHLNTRPRVPGHKATMPTAKSFSDCSRTRRSFGC